MQSPLQAPRVYWLNLVAAARILGSNPDSLRRAIERRARLAADGVLEASFDGLRARKHGGRWRVALSDAWLRGAQPDTNLGARPRATSRATPDLRPSHTTKPEKD